MAKGNVHLHDTNFIAIKHIHAETSKPKQEIANMLIAWALEVINQAKEQGIKDKDIPDFLNVLEENAVFNDDIRHIAQNYIESKEN